MRDEDVIVKTERHGAERILVWSAFAIVLGSALLLSGHSSLAVGLFVSTAIVSVVNIFIYRRTWIDAPKHTALKYFFALAPYIASTIIAVIGAMSPSLSIIDVAGVEYYALDADNPALITTAAETGFHSILGSLVGFSAAAFGLSLYFITDSRYVIRKILLLCGAAAAGFALFGFAYAAVADISGSGLPKIGLFWFSTFPDASQWSAFAILWTAGLFAAASYSDQRFSFATVAVSARFWCVVGALVLLASVVYCGTPLEIILAFGIAAFGFMVLAADVLPTKAAMKKHGGVSVRVRIAKSPSVMILPLACFVLLSFASFFVAVSEAVSCIDKPYCSMLAAKNNGNALTISEREAIESDILEPIEMRPIFGWGTDSFPTVFAFFQGSDLGEGVWDTPNSDLLKKLFENGIVGLVLAFITPSIFFLLWLARRRFNLSALTMLFGVAAVLALSVVGTPFQSISVLASFWIIMMGAFKWSCAEVK